MRNRKTISVSSLRAVFAAALLLVIASCSKDESFSMDRSAPVQVQTEYHHFTTSVSYEHVLLLYQAGFNSLSSYLDQNIEDLCKGDLPLVSRNVLLVYSHVPERAGRYSVRTSPVLCRISRDYTGTLQVDTLVTYPTTTVSSSAQTVNTVLSYVQERFPANSYGLILCSHASGWLPTYYYNDPSYYEESSYWSVGPSLRSFGEIPPPPYTDLPSEGSVPAVRSFGQDRVLSGSTEYTYEINIRELAKAIPMHLDYILFDACLMGCVEVAYEFREVCDRIGFSPTEVLAEGFVYETVPAHLLKDNPDVQCVLEEFFDKYDKMSGAYRSATVSYVDCTKMDRLAGVCADLVAKYRSSLQTLDPDRVQRYFRFGRNYFYDLEDIFLKAGITSSEAATLRSALDEAVVYKAATPSFIDSFDIVNYSGLSMYLPSIETDYPERNYSYLNRFYRESVSWNDAVGLVR